MSRMCTSVEVMETVPDYAFGSTESAWVRPVLSPIGGGTTATLNADASGRTVHDPNYTTDQIGHMSCGGWSSSIAGSSRGLTVNDAGQIVEDWCGVARPVTCCALIQVPEQSLNSGLAMGIAALSLLGKRRRRGRNEGGETIPVRS